MGTRFKLYMYATKQRGTTAPKTEKLNRDARRAVTRPDPDRGRARKEPERAAASARYPRKIGEKRNLQTKPVLGRVCDAIIAAGAGVRAMGMGAGQRHHRE